MDQNVKTPMSRNKKLGIFFIILPFIGVVGLGLLLALYAMSSFMIVQAGGGSAVFGSILRILFGLGGIVCILSILGGFPVGIYFLVKK